MFGRLSDLCQAKITEAQACQVLMKKYMIIAKYAMFLWEKFELIAKLVQNLDRISNFEHVMKVVSFDEWLMTNDQTYPKWKVLIKTSFQIEVTRV